MAKGHVIYEGKSGHIVSYDGMFLKYWYFKQFLSLSVATLSRIIYYFVKCCFPSKAIKNSRENTLKRTYDMIEGPMSRAHSGRDGAPFEGNSFVFKLVNQTLVMLFWESNNVCTSFRVDQQSLA